MKIEKMADNEVMKVQEMNRLEQEEKSLYGFDLSNYIQNKDVQDAEGKRGVSFRDYKEKLSDE